jgi:signal transduction histidine kinase
MNDDPPMETDRTMNNHTQDSPTDPAAFLHELRRLQAELTSQNVLLERLQSAVADTRDLGAAFHDLSPVGHWTLAIDGRILDASRTAAAHLRINGDVVWNAPFSEFVAPRDLGAFDRLLNRAVEGDEQVTGDLQLQRHDGSEFNARLHCVRVTGIDGAAQVRVAVIDIGDQLALVRARNENIELRARIARRMVLVQEEARRRLSGELHDRTSPNLAAIEINLDIIASGLPENHAPELAERLEDTRGLLRDTANSVREICADLRPPVLDYAGLRPALVGYAKQTARRTGIPIVVESADAQVRLDSHVESLLFRIAQEALTNCAKHAHAQSVVIRLAHDAPHVTLSIIDDGIGFDADAIKGRSSVGLGLLNMSEMAEFAGGACVIESAPSRGTTVRVEI